jgi:tetratricopeptide (TPR) repeat protein
MRPKKVIVALFLIWMPTSVLGQSKSAPLSRAEILGHLALAESPSEVAKSVKTQGIGFTTSEDFLSHVKLAGGDGILVERLSAAEPSNSAASLSEPDRPFDHLAKCAEYLHTGDTEQAEKECRASIDENPQSPWPLLATANVLRALNMQGNEVVEILRRAAALAPAIVEAHVGGLVPQLSDQGEGVAERIEAPPVENPDQPANADTGTFADTFSGLGPEEEVRRVEVSPSDEYRINGQLESLLKAEPELASTHIILANHFQQVGNAERCIREYREALHLEPDNPQLHANFAQFYETQQNFEEEIAELREAARIVPYGYQQRQTLAQALESQGQMDEAVREWRDLIALSPRNVPASNDLVELYTNLKDSKSAIAELRRSLKASSDAIGDDAKYADERMPDIDHLGFLLKENREFEAAGEQYAFLLRFKPDESFLHNNYGNVFYAQGRVDQAIQEYREALRLGPDSPETHHNLANCLLIKKNADEALVEYRRALGLKPDEFDSRFMLGVAFMEKGDFSSAIGQFQELASEKPENPNVHAALGHAYYLNNDMAYAVSELKQSLLIKPGSPIAENDLAWIYATSPDPQYRKPAEALTLAKHAVQSSKEPVPAIIDTLAEALLINGQAAEAVKTEEQAVKLAPDDAQMQARLKHFQEAAHEAAEQAKSAKQ